MCCDHATFEERAQVVAELFGIAVAVDGPGGHRLLADRDELGRDGLRESLERRRSFGARELDEVEGALRAIAVGRMAREDVIEDRAEAVDVGALVEPLDLAARLLGRHVGRRAHDVALLREERRVVARAPRTDHRLRRVGVVRATDDLREAPVHDEDLAEASDHDVGGLQVAVQDAALVREGHRLRCAHQRLEEAGRRPLLARRLVGQERCEVAPAHQLHREVRPSTGVQPDVVHGDDARVVELAGHLGLGQEALDALGVRRIGERLHRDAAIELEVLGLVHRAHPAAADFFSDAVALLARRAPLDEPLAERRFESVRGTLRLLQIPFPEPVEEGGERIAWDGILTWRHRPQRR